jgi:ABC-type transporter Mla maintaining outer membrane lipid asymmetry ATPase subunit MlaF
MKEGTIYWVGTPDELAASKDPTLVNFVQGRSENREGWEKIAPCIDTGR